MNVAVIGYGYWGPNLVRNFMRASGMWVKVVCDFNPKVEQSLHNIYPDVEFKTDWKEVVRRPDIDAVVVATPVSSHFEIGKGALENGKHLFMEKPFTASSREAEELIEIAEQKNLKIMVDHTFLFTGAVRKIKEIIEEGVLGNILYFDSARVNLGLIQKDINVIWDLAPHDLSIMRYFIKSDIKAVSAIGMNYMSKQEEIAYINIHFEDNTMAHFNVNWLSPVKIRSILIGGDKKMLVWNDILADDKIKIYDKGVEVASAEEKSQRLISYRSGDMWAPKVDPTEALQIEAQYFADCIMKNETPFNDGYAGLEVVKILEACDKSMESNGALIELKTLKPTSSLKSVAAS